jgi:K+/H+ antiporter YhaU regulatory subunit KhtT
VATTVTPAADEVIQAGDVLTVIGNSERLSKLDRLE